MKQPALRAQIRQLCCLGLPAETLMPRLLPLIRQFVPAESAGFFWVDGRGDIKNLYAERMLPSQQMQLYFERYYDTEHPFRSQFLARARSGQSVDSTSADSALQRTAYYNEIMRELDAHHVLYGVVRDHGAALGQLSLYRPRTAHEFDQKSRSDLAAILHYVAHAIAAGQVVDARVRSVPVTPLANPKLGYTDTEEEAVVIANDDGELLQASDAARRLLVKAVDGAFAPGPLRAAQDAVTALTVRMAVLLKRTDERPPVQTMNTRWGRIQLRAYRLGEVPTGPFAMRILRQEPMLLHFSESLRTLGLPPQQHEILLRVAQGAGNREIAADMGLSPNTVAYHIKQIFSRLDIHERGEAINSVLSRGQDR